MYSAAQVDVVTVFWLVDDHAIGELLSSVVIPVTDFLVVGSLA